MTSRTTGLRYLNALFEICRELEAVEEVLGVLVSLSGAIEESGDLRDFLFNPRMGRKEKKRVLINLLDGAPPLARDFAGLLVDKGREEVLSYAGEEFGNLLRASRNVLVAQVQVAHALDGGVREDLRKHLGAATGKNVELIEEIKKELLGGVRVIFGSRMIDASLKNRLEKMRRHLKGGRS